MPYVLKKYDAINGMKIEEFLTNVVKLPTNLAFSLLQKGRIVDDRKKRLQKGIVLKSGFVEVCVFEPTTKGLKPIFQTEHFAIFDKPSGVSVHPKSRSTKYTLLDEIRYHFDNEANLAHRIDAQTSGLVLVTKNRYAQMIFNEMFENKNVKKTYKALVEGKISSDIKIDKKISNSTGLIKIKMKTSNDGKDSITLIKPIKYDEKKNQTLVEAKPFTGRQHQIRVHLDSISHRIIGDRIYGIDEAVADKILKKEIEDCEIEKITGAKRLMLHAYSLEFTFLKRQYKFCSQEIF